MPAVPKTAISANLDLLRAIAVLCVFISHLLNACGIHNIGSLGRFGVIIFFVHTSFVLMQSLERLDLSGRSDLHLIEAFWLRRIFRIYPLAILFVIFAAIFRVPSNPDMIYSWIGIKAFLSNLALVENLTSTPDILGPLWSLPLEVQMYVMLPFAYFTIRGNTRYRSAALWALSIPVAIAIPRLSSRLDVFLYAPSFISGIVAFDLLRTRSRYARKLPYWLWPIGIVAAITLFGPLDNVSLPDKIYRAWILSLALGLLYVNVHEGPCNLAQRLFHWIAEHSYGIYLSHIVLIWFVFYPLAATPFWVRALVLTTSIIAIPSLLYRFIEKPLILVGSHLSLRLLRHHGQPDGPRTPPNRVALRHP